MNSSKMDIKFRLMVELLHYFHLQIILIEIKVMEQ